MGERAAPRAGGAGERRSIRAATRLARSFSILLALSLMPGLLHSAEEPRAVEPAEGRTVGPRPVFRFTSKGGVKPDGHAVIEISRDRWKSLDHVWDSNDSPRGWSLPGPLEPWDGSFRCPQALMEGSWEWRVRLSLGEGAAADTSRPAAFRIDATPPAEIEGLKLQHRSDGAIALTWEPVLYDVEGKPETVDHYVIYRYSARGIFPQAAPMKIGESRGASFVDRAPQSPRPGTGPRDAPAKGAAGSNVAAGADLPAKPGPAVNSEQGGAPAYYKVVAVDSAGNELGVRDLPPPEPLRPSRGTPP